MSSRSFANKRPRVPHMTHRGQGGVAGEVWDLRADTESGFESIENEVDDLILIRGNNVELARGKIELNLLGPGLVSQIDPLNPQRINVSSNVGSGSYTNLYWPGVDTSLLSMGLFAHENLDGILVPTDAADVIGASAVGLYDGAIGNILTYGITNTVKFAETSPIPTPGARVYLARADDEPSNGAAGKVTTSPPPTHIADVGVVLEVNAVTFLTTRTAKILVRIQGISQAAPPEDVVRLNFTYASSPLMLLQALLPSDLIDRIAVLITTPFNGPGANLSVGTSADYGAVLGVSDSDLSNAGQYQRDEFFFTSVQDLLFLTINAEGSTQGAGILLYKLRR